MVKIGVVGRIAGLNFIFMFAVAAFYLFLMEARAMTSSERWAGNAPAFSLTSDTAALSECLADMTSTKTRLSKPLQKSTSAFCVTLASTILQTSHTNAFAHFVLAVSLDLQENSSQSLWHLRQSNRLAPAEHWLVALRLRFATSRANDAAIDGENFRHDLTLIFHTPRGHQQLAQLYIAHPRSKNLIDSVLPQQSPQVQRSFLAALRQVSGQN